MGATFKKTNWRNCPHFGQSRAVIKTGTYTGDGNATKAITGIGFEPSFVFIQDFVNNSNKPFWKIDDMGLNALLADANGTYAPDMIISLDADGFTVGDGTGVGNFMNINGVTYGYLAIGEET